MENHHFQWVNSLQMTIFPSYVSLPEGIKWRCSLPNMPHFAYSMGKFPNILPSFFSPSRPIPQMTWAEPHEAARRWPCFWPARGCSRDWYLVFKSGNVESNVVKMVRPGLWLFRVVYCGFSLLGFHGFVCVFYFYGSIKMWPQKSLCRIFGRLYVEGTIWF